MRRLVFPLGVAAVLLLTGCGDERPDRTRPVASTFSAVPTPEPKPTDPSPAMSPAGPTGPLAGFPLDLGYDHETGADHSPAEVTRAPATKAFGLCGRQVWDPHHGTTDVLGVELTGESEWARGRTLVLFPTEEAARDAVAGGHDAVAACPEDQADGLGNATAHTLLDVALGDQSVSWIDRFQGADGRFDTGLVVYDLVRVGRAVLMSYQYDEGNGSDQSRNQSIREATDADGLVVDRLGELPTAPGPAA